ncbi:MAG: DUF104 domain-containing protein [Syntrophaceae bacterium]|nr:DUF104 domain-containing protein [Syntrophaceae bacterium]
MVAQTFEAVYDGKVLRPKKKLMLEPNTSVQVTIRAIKAKSKKIKSALEVIESLKMDAPSDWAENIEEYLQAEKRI